MGIGSEQPPPQMQATTYQTLSHMPRRLRQSDAVNPDFDYGIRGGLDAVVDCNFD